VAMMLNEPLKKKVIIMTPTRKRPHPAYISALEASVPAMDAAGWEHGYLHRAGNPYISFVMADMLSTALTTDAGHFLWIDDDVSWRPEDLIKLLDTEGSVVAGTYRFKQDDELYMGSWKTNANQRIRVRDSDGAVEAVNVPSGFLKMTRYGVRQFMRAYPTLMFGEPDRPAIDLFNHGVIIPNDGRWWGQDYAFCRRWTDAGGQIWCVPDLCIDHHSWTSDEVWKGNLHQHLLRLPGGSHEEKSADRAPPDRETLLDMHVAGKELRNGEAERHLHREV
jgi:hypothetical protein